MTIYIREAHALDSVLPERQRGRWLAGSPERNLFVEDPVTPEERLALARRCEQDMQLGFPVLVDGLDDAVNEAYSAWPERLYLVDLDGRIAYRGAPGPNGFHADELAAELDRCTGALAGRSSASAAPDLESGEGPASGRGSDLPALLGKSDSRP